MRIFMDQIESSGMHTDLRVGKSEMSLLWESVSVALYF